LLHRVELGEATCTPIGCNLSVDWSWRKHQWGRGGALALHVLPKKAWLIPI